MKIWSHQVGLELTTYQLGEFRTALNMIKVKREKNWNLSCNYRCASFQEECEVARQVETAGQPFTFWHIQLGPTFICKRLQVENCILKSDCVYGFAIAHCPKLCDGDAVGPRRQSRTALALVFCFSLYYLTGTFTDAIAHIRY